MILDTLESCLKELEKLVREMNAMRDFLTIQNGTGPPLQTGGEGKVIFEGKTVRLSASEVTSKANLRHAVEERMKSWPATLPDTHRNRIACKVQTALRSVMFNLASEDGITRRALMVAIQKKLSSKIRGDVNPRHNRARWEDCLQNMLRNYVATKYVRVVQYDKTGSHTNSAMDVFHLGGK